jgi:TatD DNase family protein
MFDTHCHLHDGRLLAEAPALLARARVAGVERLLLAGVDPQGWPVEDALAAAHPGVYVSYGIHPQIVAEIDDDACDEMLAALAAALRTPAPHLVAVGEIGLDGMGERRDSLARQERLFRAQLELANRHQLPVSLHVLRQHPRALAILRQIRPTRGGVLHSCSASPELAAQYVALGLHVSFSGALTWHGGDNRARRAVASVPRDRLLVETDAPDQTPEPHRPRRNEPAFLVAIVAVLAQIWGVTFAEAACVTDANACRLFQVEPP